MKSRFDFGAKPLMNSLPDDSIMSWYLSIEKGKFWFPAQVYNREVYIYTHIIVLDFNVCEV